MTAGIKGLTDVAKTAANSNWFGLGGNNNSQNSINAWTQSTQNDPNYQGVTW